MDPFYEFALAVKAIQRELDRVTTDAMRPLGLTGPQSDALVVIGDAEPLSLNELGALLIAEAGHPSRLVDRLVGAGLVDRVSADQDRRRVELRLTGRGRRVRDGALEVRLAILAAAAQHFDRAELEPALEVLRRFVEDTSYAELFQRRTELERRR